MRYFASIVGCIFVLSLVSGKGTQPAQQPQVGATPKPQAAVVQPQAAAEQPQRKLKLLFFGDKSGHAPDARYHQLEPVMAKRGIEIGFTGTVNSINAKTLSAYDG